MRRAKVRVGGGCRGRLVYWAYRIEGDIWSDEVSRLRSSGFRFLPRKDKLGVMSYFLGLKSALYDMLDDMRRRGIREQYLVKFYCVSEKVREILSRWGCGLRDPLIIGAVNTIRHLADAIGILKFTRPKNSRVEEELRIYAASQFYSRVNEILKHSRLWDSSNEDRYIVCSVPADSDEIPLEFLANFLYKREERVLKRSGGRHELRGVIVVRECGSGQSLTRIFLYSPKRGGSIARLFKQFDRRYLSGRLASKKSLCVTRSSSEEVEEILAEVLESCGM